MAEGLTIYNSQLVNVPSSTLCSLCTEKSAQDAFELYHKIQEYPGKPVSYLSGPALPALGHAIAGAIGASISNICTYPLALVITRLQIQRQLRKAATSPDPEEYKSVEDAFKKIYDREQGLNGFYVGVLSDTTKTIADSFLFFLAYNFIRQSRLRSRKSSARHLPVLDELSVGFLAGAFSKFFTTPIANIVTRKQTSSMLSACSPDKSIDHASVRQIANQIQKEKGLSGYWSGYSASLVLTLNPSLTFFFFETLKRFLLSRKQRAKTSAQLTFVLAAISKACASSITYPFSLAKSRLQASGRAAVAIAEKEKSKHEQARDPSNVFTTIFALARTEGIPALYEGLSGEVFKGFFSHGITMIVKDAVHKLVIQLYYALLKLLKRYPSPEQLAEMAKLQAAEMREQAQLAAGKAGASMREVAGRSAEMARSAVESVKGD